MHVRQAQTDDLSAVLSVYATAREYMKRSGNPDQWGDSYPQKELLEGDIRDGLLFVIVDSVTENAPESIVGVFAFFPDGDPIYNNIEGKWLNDLPHAAIHRVASSGAARGILAKCIEFCSVRSRNLKIDTHSANLTMQKALEKHGFSQCGRIFLENGDPRIAYQRYSE